MMTVLEKNYITITYDEGRKLLKSVWHGFANSEQYREVLRVSMDFYKSHEVFYSFSDNRKMKAIRPADQEYTNEHILPEFFKISSLKKSATIVSEDIFNRMAVDSILTKANDHIKFDMRFFDSEEEAMEWLKQDNTIAA